MRTTSDVICLRLLLLVAAGTAGCSGDDGAPALFPDDYAATYQEVRNCRRSLDHDLKYIRVMASPDAVAAYESRTEPFPAGAIVVKEQYGENDTTCSGEIVDYTAMLKLEAGAAPEALDWEWQQASAAFREVETGLTRCISCHSLCGVEPEGYDGTCAMP